MHGLAKRKQRPGPAFVPADPIAFRQPQDNRREAMNSNAEFKFSCGRNLGFAFRVDATLSG
jgi:hypothetical protein